MVRVPLILFVILFTKFSLPSIAQVVYNVTDFGAKADGQTDSTDSFLSAWANACGSPVPATLYVPGGTFLLGQASFRGPCSNAQVTFHNDGTIIAHPEFDGGSEDWIAFDRVEGMVVYGGTVDGQGHDLWSCRSTKGDSQCPRGTKSITVTQSRNVTISTLTSVNSKRFHIFVNNCEGVRVDRVRLIAPDNSLNTDGIHTMLSKNISIENSEIRTGDDCVSIGDGTSDLRINNITCGPGHGISIGSLGNKLNEHGVQNISVSNVLFRGTKNGLRIKTWARPSNGFVRGVTFDGIKMSSVEHPIIIDQYYCPHEIDCPNADSGVQVSEVEYKNIEGSSAKMIAACFNCSRTNPCRGISLKEINLEYQNQTAQSYCSNAEVTTSGLVSPPTCPSS